MAPRGRRTRRGRAALAAGALAVAGLVAASPPTVAGTTTAEPVVEDLTGPRGVAVGPAGRVVFTEIDGSFSQLTTRGKAAGEVTELGEVPATYIAPALAMAGRGQTFLLTAGGPPGSGGGTLYRWNPGAGVRAVADVTAYQQHDPDPFNVELTPEESNPFGVAVLPDGSALVVDAAGNDLLRVHPDGSIVTVARIKPRTVPVPEGLPDTVSDPLGNPVEVPPAGTLVESEGVPTAVAVGPDGAYYVGELRGFPATPGTSQVWRIAPGTVGAVCDPAAPHTGACQVHADGFTSIVGLDAARDGSLYVVELSKASWIGMQLGRSPVGSLYRLAPDGGARTELVPGELILPGGVAVSKEGTVYVTHSVFGPGVVAGLG